MVERIYFQTHMVIGGIPFLSGYWTLFLGCYQFHATWTFPVIQLASSKHQSKRVSKQDGSHYVMLYNHGRDRPSSLPYSFGLDQVSRPTHTQPTKALL